ncbi:glycosyltransferase family 2 protein [Pasteurellaceae bacterium LIM206]|nr:glycosyltransferase family 2 protein [Pasteurellaceae bacterium LIM206]
MINSSICAVVVTYNRKQLLMRCLEALVNQTRVPDHILIINNASTDGTVELLEQNGWLTNEHITLLTLSENMGGAGGFYQGVKTVTEQGFDFVWLMDDDGYPEKNCLQELLKYCDDNSYIGPLVLDQKNKDKFCFPMRIPNSLIRLNFLSDLIENNIKNKVDGIVIPFNGILFSTALSKKLGYPKQEYFIWGDDIEYTLRMESNNVTIASIVNAKFYHPKEESLGTSMMFGLLHYNDTNSQVKLYCMCRNAVANNMRYNGFIRTCFFIIKPLWFYTFTNPSFSKLKLSVRAIWHGLTGNFSHHREYL